MLFVYPLTEINVLYVFTRFGNKVSSDRRRKRPQMWMLPTHVPTHIQPGSTAELHSMVSRSAPMIFVTNLASCQNRCPYSCVRMLTNGQKHKDGMTKKILHQVTATFDHQIPIWHLSQFLHKLLQSIPKMEFKRMGWTYGWMNKQTENIIPSGVWKFKFMKNAICYGT